MSPLTQPLVLASTSKPRCLALARLRLPFVTVAPDVDESPRSNESATTLVKRLAHAKAISVSQHHPDKLIIGGDQVGEVKGTVLGKPKDHEGAVQQLLQSSGNAVHFHHGLCLLNNKTRQVQLSVETTVVHFRTLTREQIERYLLREKPYQCAGSLMAESLGISLVTRIDTQDPHSLFGLPLIQLVKMLEQAGVDIVGEPVCQ